MRGRVRGYAPWQPRPDTEAVLRASLAVLDEYRQHLPMTLRQVFYRLVGTAMIGKTEADYARLCEMMNRARRAGLVPWDVIRDDGADIDAPTGYISPEHFIAEALDADYYRRRPREGQPLNVLVLTEAAGMLPMVANAVRDLGASVASSGGFDSVTFKRSLAERARKESLAILHVGDHDPSGVHVYSSLVEDVSAFAIDLPGRIEFDRVAVLPSHIEQYDLPTAPPKKTDRRSFDGDTVQAEALPPDVLVSLVRQAVIERTDMALMEDVRQLEALERDRIEQAFALARAALDGAR